MKLSEQTYVRSAQVTDNPENLSTIINTIDSLHKSDITAFFPSLSINDERLFFLPTNGNGVLSSRTILKSGYQSLLSKIGIPYRLVDNSTSWVEVPLVNGKIISNSQKSHQSNVVLRLIEDDVRAVLSSSYTAVDDKEIISLIEKTFLPRINTVSFGCDHTNSNTRIVTRDQSFWSHGNYSISMFLYVSNSEIGDASVRCGLGIVINNTLSPERRLSFEFTRARDTRVLGRVIHRGDAIKRLEKELSNLFETAHNNWNLIQNALVAMSNVDVQNLPNIEDKMIKALKTMPEFETWKTQYDAMRESSVITNMFDLIYLMTSIPYRDESFGSIVEEMLFGRFF